MKNALIAINELNTRIDTIVTEARKEMTDITAILLGEYPAEVKAEIAALEVEREELKKEYAYVASYYNTVRYIVGYFKTENEAREALAEYADHLSVITHAITHEDIAVVSRGS